MKKLNLILVMMLLISSNVFAQWTTGGNTWNAYGATDWNLLGNNNIRSIGIGHKQMFGGFIEGWTTGNPPRAALHVNAHYLSNSPAFTPGHMFRTDGPSNQDNMWQMFTGNNYGNSTEKARLYVPANSQHFSLQSSTGDMRFHTGGTTQRMRILGSNGFVAIGQDFNNPQSLLSIDGTNDNTGEVFRTNTSSGLNTFWRMEITNKERGAIFSLSNASDAIDNNNLGIQASEQDITFHAPPLDANGIGAEYVRISGHNETYLGGTVSPGNVGIGNKHPLTMLHIGADHGGWRDWMDIGTFYGSRVDNGKDNMYVGLWEHAFDQHDAIVSWGNNPLETTAADRLRFIFTAYETAGVAASANEGLEIARMTSNGDYGRMGIGDFNTLGQEPTHTLDVIGNARLRELPENQWQDNSLNKFVVVDDEGVLHWSNDVSTGSALGNICGNAPNNLTDNWEIPLNDNNFVFSGQGPVGTNGVGIGIDDCTPEAKLDVLQEQDDLGLQVLNNSGILQSIAIFGLVEDAESQTGVTGFASAGTKQRGVAGISENAFDGHSVGVYGQSRSDDFIALWHYGGQFEASNGLINQGVNGYALASGSSPLTADTEFNIGGYFSTNEQANYNLGVYGKAVPFEDAESNQHNFAGYFDGHVNINGDLVFNQDLLVPSDEQFKQNILSISNGLETVRQLRPVQFSYDTSVNEIQFPSGNQFGLIAQEVELFAPELVKQWNTIPSYDTAGNIITESLSFKALNYLELTPILTQAVKEIDDTIQQIVLKPETPILNAPENNDTISIKDEPEFIWHQAGHAQYYQVVFSYQADMSNVFQSFTSIDTLQTESFKLNHDTTIYWAVKAYNAFGESELSDVRHLNYMYGFDNKTSQSYSTLSDATMKTNINPIENALQKTLQLNGVSFEWDTEQSQYRNLSEGVNLGLIAQEMQPIFPEVVKTDENGFLYIDYTSLVPVLVEALKEQQGQIDELQQQINELASLMNNCCNDQDKADYPDTESGSVPDFSQTIDLHNTYAVVLNQNVPNPFKEKTSIRFYIPEEITSASMHFVNNQGRIIKLITITQRGHGELLVYANDLSAGLYTYYLIADGKKIDSRKMTRSN
jgi:hypothetical protein